MELLHQRVYSLQMALSLAENTTHESRQVEKVLTFSANALQEAATLGLTAWKQKLTVAINLLRARNQLEAAQQFRLLTDQLVRGNTKMLADMTTKIGEMQQCAFVAADAIVQANDSLGKIIATARQKDVERSGLARPCWRSSRRARSGWRSRCEALSSSTSRQPPPPPARSVLSTWQRVWSNSPNCRLLWVMSPTAGPEASHCGSDPKESVPWSGGWKRGRGGNGDAASS